MKLLHPEEQWIPADGQEQLALLGRQELERLTELFRIPQAIAEQFSTCRTSKFESHPGFDFICLRVPSRQPGGSSFTLYAYFCPGLLALYCDRPSEYPVIRQLCEEYGLYQMEKGGLSKLLYGYLEKLIQPDAQLLEDMEQQISALENSLLTRKKEDCVREITTFRRRLLKLKRFYRNLFSIAQSMEENENGLTPKNGVKLFKILRQHADRLTQDVLNLQEYVNQVREVYQSQVDINQNNLMKIFTVITVIFLPLTLIAGWYGMNFDMPEYGLSFGYPLIILVSAAILLICLIWFKKKKWF